MKKLVILFAVILLISACRMLPIKEAGRFNSPKNTQETIKSLEKLVLECWTKPVGKFGSDEIYGRFLIVGDDLLITLGRDNTDIPFIPFAHIRIRTKRDANPEIIVEQGSVAYGVFYDVYKGVQDWFNYDLPCRPLDSFSVEPKSP